MLDEMVAKQHVLGIINILDLIVNFLHRCRLQLHTTPWFLVTYAQSCHGEYHADGLAFVGSLSLLFN